MASVAQPYAPPPEERQRQAEDQQKQEKRITRARLVQRLVANDGNLPEFMHDLITTQAIVVAGTEAAGFLIEGKDSEGKPELRTVAHIRPDNSEEAVRRQAIMAFREIVTQCIIENKDGALTVGGGTDEVDPQFCLVTLLRSDDRVVAATAVITRCKDESRALQRLSTMQLVAGYFDFFLLKRQNEQSRQAAKTHQDVFQYASTVATAENFHASAAGLCNELATRAGAARVAIGWVKGRRIKLMAISHTEEFDKKQELSVQLVKTMEECFDQEEFTQFDPAGASTDNVTREAMTLSQMEGGNRVASLPLRRKDKIIGVMTLEFPPEKPGSPQESTALAVAAELLAPQLYDRYENDRYLITKAGISTKNTTKMVVGLRQHTLAKVLIAAAVALILFIFLYSPMYRVSAPFAFVPENRVIVDAPYQGTILEVMHDVGDEVRAGDVLLRLDTRELEIERSAKILEAMQARLEAHELRGRDVRREPTARAQAEARDLHADLLELQASQRESQIERASIRAPIDGIILQSPGGVDLRERRGTSVNQGDQLVLIGDRDKLRVQIAVADRDIQNVWEGQPGTLATAARPNVKVPIVVESIVEAAEAQEGTNAFTVYARALETDRHWRPSGTGEVRLDVEERPLIRQWTHRLVDWVRLKLWI